jgi:hypothetical protein
MADYVHHEDDREGEEKKAYDDEEKALPAEPLLVAVRFLFRQSHIAFEDGT